MVILLILFLVFLWVVVPIWILVKILAHDSENQKLQQQLRLLEGELARLRENSRQALRLSDVAHLGVEVKELRVLLTQLGVAVAAPAVTPVEPVVTAPAVEPAAPSIPSPAESKPVVSTEPAAAPSGPIFPPAEPAPALPPPVPPVLPAPVFARTESRVNWEQFIGAKGFAWLGGLALLLGVAFFIKYSFDHNLVPPEARVAVGFLFGTGLIVGGLRLSRERYAITVQTLCATGAVCLYTVTFACNSIYHFAFFGPLPTFALMVLITATAFLLAVRLNARVVAVLGMLGGFLTPVLLSTGVDNPGGLFGYLALLNVGLIAVALYQRWFFLVPLGAGGTVLMLLGWTEKFFAGEKATTAVVVILGFCALFLAAYEAARRTQEHVDQKITGSALAFPFVAFGYALFFFAYPAVADRPGLVFTFVLLADVALLTLGWIEEDLPQLHLVAGAAVFVLLSIWTMAHLTTELLPWALTFYLLYAVLHTAFPVVLERRRAAAQPAWWSQLFPPLTLLLMLGPLFKLEAVSFLLWPCILLVDLIAIGLALLTASLTAVALVLVLTLVATGLWIFQVPATVAVAPLLLLVVGAFAALFFAAGLFLTRKLGDRLRTGDHSSRGDAIFGDMRSQLPAFSALLPFLLLIMMSERLPLADPSPVFGLALLLVILTLGLSVLLSLAWLPACALAGVAALEYAWHARLFNPGAPNLALGWYLGFAAIFSVFPFVFRRRFSPLTGPWAAAALGGVVHFPLAYRAVIAAWPNDFMGVLPLLFAVPPLVSLAAILGDKASPPAARLNQLAWFGGAALFFITLIFPIQFDRQWITLGWALEGAALLWLFHRVPHPGLRATGAGLLVVAFVRLALNPAVLEYHARSETAVLNWYLYTYGLVTACLFAGARLLAPPRETVAGLSVPPLLNGLGLVLAFLLLNLEIADYFSLPGHAVLTFQFSGNFARDMTYTIAWALFALGLLLGSIWKQTKAGRYAAIGLLGVALLKLFLHDLSQLGSLYRIGALFTVAVIAIIASFAYQRFLPGNDKNTPAKS